jgi:hypothetical protein
MCVCVGHNGGIGGGERRGKRKSEGRKSAEQRAQSKIKIRRAGKREEVAGSRDESKKPRYSLSCLIRAGGCPR